MGSTQSNLPAMEDTEDNRRNRDSEMSRRQQQQQRRRSHHRHQREVVETSHEASGDDPWWWEIENENLLLDRVPNVTAEQSANAVVVPLSDDFNTLLKIGQDVSLTLNNGNNKNNDNNNDNNNTANNNSENNNNSLEDSESFDNDEINPKGQSENMSNPPIDSESVARPSTGYSSNTAAAAAAATGSKWSEPSQSLDEFREELRQKRMARQTAVQDLRSEMATLRRQLAAERDVTRRLRNGEEVDEDVEEVEEQNEVTALQEKPGAETTPAVADGDIDEDDANACSRGRHANIELANAQLALQLANSENISLRSELGVVQKQVGTLKEVVACCKQMLAMKEEQCVQLKTKLSDIEESFGEREMKIMSDNLRQEYERQLTNIRQLRQLYEERQRIAAAEHENLQRLISIKKDELTAEQERTKTFEERNQALLKEVEAANNELAALREECNEHKFEKKALKEEMGAVNTLFSQMVMGFNGKNNLDIDRLATMLEENRTLLNDMATKEANCSDGATLPKLLFELVEQAAIGGGGSRSGSCSPGPGASDEDENEGDGDEEQAEGVVRGERDCDEVDDANNKESTVTSNNNNNNNEDNNSGNADDCEVESADGAATDVGEATTEEAQEQRRRRRLLRQREEEGEEAAEDNGINNCSNGSISNIVTATTNNTNNNNNVNGNKKQHHHHHRKSAANKTKMSTSSTGGASPSTSRSLTSTSSSSSAATFRLHEPEVIGKVASTQEIIGNLPKVWKVLMELLSHHKIEQVQFEENGASEDCYKSVETPNGPKAELSVSKTYIKLKDLILEKKSLVKETNRLKTLNSHLDYRLNEQEKRLSAVSLELTKTWHLVGKMQRQHRQLHTQEQILRYQLQQKRRLLSELKDELEYCRRKWAAARAKNDESQEQCNDLRREFAKRKLEDANSNSAESGYSDSGPASDEEERTTSSGAAAASTSMASTATSSLVVTTASSLVPTVSSLVASAASSMASALSSKATALSTKATASSSKAAASVASSTPSGRTKGELRGRFEHSRKIKRMQSTSPGRAAAAKAGEGGEILLRWNSAPPTCGWRAEDDDDGESDDDDNEEEEDLPGTSSKGAVPKRTSRSKQRGRGEPGVKIEDDQEEAAAVAPPTGDRAVRIQRLEEQCKSLIQQVLETSDNRERLEVQLCRFQDEIAPVQYAIPLDQFISKKRLERMTRASSAPASGALTPREEEYTRKRSERLGRLEEESRQLISRIKRTSDRGHYLRCSLERLHRGGRAASASLGGVGASGISREGSFESNTEDEEPEGGVERVEASGQVKASVQVKEDAGQKKDGSRNHEDGSECDGSMDLLSKDPLEPSEDQPQRNPLTPAEEAYTARRAERLRRLEEEGRQLLTRLSRNTQRGSSLETRLDTLHERHAGQSQEDDMTSQPPSSSSTTSSKSSPSSSSSTTSPTSPTIEKRIANIERISSNRDERLRILEEEGKQLISRLSSTSERGTRMINRIAEREQNRLARQSETPAKESETSIKESETKESETKAKEKDPTTTSTTSTTTSTTSVSSSTLTTSTPSSSSSSDSNNSTPSTSSTPSTTSSPSPSKTSTDAAPPPPIDATPIELNAPDAAVAGALLPTMKNVACSSIVCEELAECVTVTTTPSRIARPTQGAISKTQSKAVAQLSAAKVKPKKSTVMTKSEDSESLEEMVKRLKSLPFPEEANATEAEEATTSKDVETSSKEVETSSMEDSASKDSTSEDSTPKSNVE